MEPVIVTTEMVVRVAPAHAFGVVVPISLPTVFQGWGPLPRVTGVEDQDGPWDAAGRSRTVLLAGGGRMQEVVTRYERPHEFAYTVTPVAGPLRFVVDHIAGNFSFRPAGSAATEIVWSYAFVAQPGRRLLLLGLAPLWRRYARQVLELCARAAEGPVPATEPARH